MAYFIRASASRTALAASRIPHTSGPPKNNASTATTTATTVATFTTTFHTCAAALLKSSQKLFGSMPASLASRSRPVARSAAFSRNSRASRAIRFAASNRSCAPPRLPDSDATRLFAACALRVAARTCSGSGGTAPTTGGRSGPSTALLAETAAPRAAE